MCYSVRGLLRKSNRDLEKCELKCFLDSDRKHLASVSTLRRVLIDELAKGHEVITIGDCDNFDYQTGCKGHDEEVKE